MRKRSSLAVLAVLLLVSCKRQGAFPSDQVLLKSVAAGSQLQSAEFDADVIFEITGGVKNWKGSVQLKGVVANGGKQSDLHATIDATSTGTEVQKLHAQAQLISDNLERYLNVSALTADPVHPLFAQLQPMFGMWWHIPAPPSSVPEHETLSPDPVLLRSQASVVRVTEDHGLERVRGRDAYHYTVVIDDEKLKLFLESLPKESAEDKSSSAKLIEQIAKYDVTGEIWIDAEDFLLQRVQWVIKNRGMETLRITINSDFENQNEARPVQPPEKFQELQAGSLLQMMPGATPSIPDSSLPVTP